MKCLLDAGVDVNQRNEFELKGEKLYYNLDMYEDMYGRSNEREEYE